MKNASVLSVGLALSLSLASLPLASSSAWAQRDDARGGGDDPSPSRRIEPRTRDIPRDFAPPTYDDVRSIDGSGNNVDDFEMNASFTPLTRYTPIDYDNGAWSMAGADRPSAREVSNGVNDQGQLVPNDFRTTDYLWQWGQFIDHDIDLSEGSDPPEFEHIAVPAGDLFFDPSGSGESVIPFNRSLYAADTGTDANNPRQQMNEITGWLDASMVYGSDEERALALRTNDGTGRLATGPDGLLPDSDGSLPNATGGSQQVLFLAGDVRANEQLGLTAMHTLFVREHNRIADRIRRRNPDLEGDDIYERARTLVGAIVQAITYEEFLPALLGPNAIPPYRGYDAATDARLRNEFSTAAYRFGHSALPPQLLRLDADLNEIPEGHAALRDAFFSPDSLRDEGGIEPFLRGLAQQTHQRIDVMVIDDVRNFLFGDPGSGGFDLAALNIQRGRDHGLPSFNDTLEAYGFARARDFSDISSDPAVQARLAATYESVDDVDLWVGGLAEDRAPDSQLGRLFHTIVAEQFTALRDGDRYWYENALGERALRRIKGTRLSEVIRRNTEIGSEIPDDVFHLDSRREDAVRRIGRRR